MSRPTVTRVTFDLPDCKDTLKNKNEKKRKQKQKKKEMKKKRKKKGETWEKQNYKKKIKKLTLDPEGRTPTFKRLTCSFFEMFQAERTLSCSDCFAKFVQLDVAHLF